MVEKGGPGQGVDFSVAVVKHDVTDRNYCNYTIKVVGPRGISFHIQDRYSSLREFQSMVKRSIGSVDVLPSFPKKKLWGNMEPGFLETRKGAI
mmetsp:Transcript_21063/g.25886  ORF Transcript_21063/g.25886 Transcript_21063/m.25886 type:complete len:93 (+) Transcript_21063:3-281(+)